MIEYDVLIPAFNAEKTIRLLLDQVKALEHPPVRVYTVDDGSQDRTAEIARNSSAIVLELDRNRGKGYALKTGFKEFLSNSRSEYLVCMDADLQHPVESIPKFIDVVSCQRFPLLIGNRKKSFDVMPFSRIISNSVSSFILSKVTGQRIEDGQCGFRVIHRDLLNDIKLEEDGFQMETEFLIQISNRGIKIHFDEIPTIYNGQMSNIKHVEDTYRFIRLIMMQVAK